MVSSSLYNGLVYVRLKWAQKFIAATPNVLDILQDTTLAHAELRLTAAEAFKRVQTGLETISSMDIKATELSICQLEEFDPVPSRVEAYVYGHSPC